MMSVVLISSFSMMSYLKAGGVAVTSMSPWRPHLLCQNATDTEVSLDYAHQHRAQPLKDAI